MITLLRIIILFLISLGFNGFVIAESPLYEEAYERTVQIPITEVDEDDCHIFNYDGYVLKVSDDVTIIGMRLFGEPHFRILIKNRCPDDSYREKLFVDGEVVGTWCRGTKGVLCFDLIPYQLLYRHRNTTLELELICTKEKNWYTGKKITKSWTGRKLKRPIYKGGEWKSELIDKRTLVLKFLPDQIRALLDRMGHPKSYEERFN